MKKYIGYIRVSTDEQAEHGFGLQAQESAIRSYSSAMGYELERIVADDGFSGASLGRPGIQEIIGSMHGCAYAGVIVFKLDRISRILKDILNMHDDIFVPCGASLISVKEQFDTQTPIGKLFFQMIGGFAEFERSVIKDRMMSGRNEKAKQGMFAGGSAPYGYDLFDGELTVNVEEAKVVCEIYRLRIERKTLQEIVDALSEGGVATKRGGSWSRKSIKTILDREDFYRGQYKHGDIISTGQHQPIL